MKQLRKQLLTQFQHRKFWKNQPFLCVKFASNMSVATGNVSLPR
jgi:hypothetical protein